MNYEDIDQLSQRFATHADHFEEMNKDHAEKYSNRDPTIDWEFNISKALFCMCQQIKELKNDHDTSKD